MALICWRSVQVGFTGKPSQPGCSFDVTGVLYDVWDNRQINGLKNYLGQLAQMLDGLEVDGTRRERAKALIAGIDQMTDYHELYNALGFKYIVDPAGVLNPLERDSFDLVVSAGVLEHVYARDTNDLVRGIWAVLKPGGLSVHSINIRDHLFQYDPTVSPKRYLQYPEWIWRLFFENDVQYINRLQRADWLQLFERAGFTFVEEEINAVDLSGVKVAKPYQQYAEVDLACGDLSIVHRKTNRAGR